MVIEKGVNQKKINNTAANVKIDSFVLGYHQIKPLMPYLLSPFTRLL
jgi:hypothetical protein